jgi:hypothetical protein
MASSDASIRPGSHPESYFHSNVLNHYLVYRLFGPPTPIAKAQPFCYLVYRLFGPHPGSKIITFLLSLVYRLFGPHPDSKRHDSFAI